MPNIVVISHSQSGLQHCQSVRGMVRKTTSLSHRTSRRILLALLLGLLQGCTHLEIEDCGGKVLGENEPRIRSSHFRMFLADLPAASTRSAPFAAMSALAYA